MLENQQLLEVLIMGCCGKPSAIEQKTEAKVIYKSGALTREKTVPIVVTVALAAIVLVVGTLLSINGANLGFVNGAMIGAGATIVLIDTAAILTLVVKHCMFVKKNG